MPRFLVYVSVVLPVMPEPQTFRLTPSAPVSEKELYHWFAFVTAPDVATARFQATKGMANTLQFLNPSRTPQKLLFRPTTVTELEVTPALAGV